MAAVADIPAAAAKITLDPGSVVIPPRGPGKGAVPSCRLMDGRCFRNLSLQNVKKCKISVRSLPLPVHGAAEVI